ncbi:MAG: hypothetical protein GY705_17135 [Bacteroidetes bacterium]|nr:hypothetical protein [Bacteroidota bacterium]
MPKTPSKKLFRLIKLLSGSEKRYFKIFIREQKDSKYTRLFDAIDAQEKFDDEALKKQIYPDEAIHSRKYSELKAYLYDWILKSLQSFDENKFVDFRLKNLLQSIKALFHRALFKDCMDQLAKGYKLTEKYEKYNEKLELLNWEKRIAYAQTDIAYLDKELGRIEKEENWCLGNLSNITAYRNIFFRLLIHLRKDASLRSDQQKLHLQDIMQDELLVNTDKAHSHLAKVLYHRIYSVYYYAITDFERFYQTGKELLNLMESKPHFLKEDVSEYISALSNYTVSCDLLNKHDEVRECLQKFKNVKPNTLDDELKIHRQHYNNKFRLCIVSGEFEEGLIALKKHLSESKHFDKAVFNRSSFYFQYFYIYFGTGNYQKALEYLNQWLSFSKSIERQDLQTIARILNLIIHYEMDNTLLLESLLRTTYRYVKKQNAVFEYERKIIGFFRDVIRIHNRNALKRALIKLKQELEILTEMPAEKAMLQLFDIVAWVESKIRNKPFSDIVKERYKT